MKAIKQVKPTLGLSKKKEYLHKQKIKKYKQEKKRRI